MTINERTGPETKITQSSLIDCQTDAPSGKGASIEGITIGNEGTQLTHGGVCIKREEDFWVQSEIIQCQHNVEDMSRRSGESDESSKPIAESHYFVLTKIKQEADFRLE